MKTVLVTGADRGIGAACVRKFAQNGYRVCIHYHQHKENARALAEETGGRLYQADLSSFSAAQEMAQQILHDCGTVDVLVNNAGMAQQKLFQDITEEEWDKMFSVNIKSMFSVTKAFLPEMIRRQRGSIINISSIWGISGASCEVHYSASKAAVIGLTKALAQETGPSGIRVNCVAPGVIYTAMNAQLTEADIAALEEETPLGRIGKAEEIAHAVFFLAEEEASFITGQILAVDGGILG